MNYRRILAFLLSLILVLTVCPVQAFAQGISAEATSYADDQIALQTSDDLFIYKEIIGDEAFAVGDVGRWEMLCSGGAKPYEYRYEIYCIDTQGWNNPTVQEYSADSAFEYCFAEAGSYSLIFQAKDANGTETKSYGMTITVQAETAGADFVVKELSDVSVEITKYKGNDVNVVIPAQIDGKTVTGIGDLAFLENADIQSVTLPASLQYIGTGAFDACTSLGNITIPDHVKTIGAAAFRNCDAFTWINIPDSVTQLGYKAFESCDQLAVVELSDKLTKIEACLFFDCHALQRVVIPAGVTEIEHDAFCNCKSMSEIVVPDSVANIGDAAFSCMFPNTVVLVCTENSFADRYAKLQGLAVRRPASNETIETNELTVYVHGKFLIAEGDTAYWTANVEGGAEPHLYRFVIMDEDDNQICCQDFSEDNSFAWQFSSAGTYTLNVNTIDANGVTNSYRFGAGVKVTSKSDANPYYTYTIEGKNCIITGTSIYDETTLRIPSEIDGYRVIGIGNGNRFLTNAENVVIPEGVEFIGSMAFELDGLKNITLPSTLQEIGRYAFFNADSLEGITIPGSVDTIGEYAFAGCDMLEYAVLKKGVKEIGQCAFKDCPNLASVTMQEGLEIIGGYAFSDSGLQEITVPSTVRDMTAAFYNATKLKGASLADGIQTISPYAFSRCMALEDVYIPDSVTRVEQEAFTTCSALKSLYFSENVEFIDVYALDRTCTIQCTPGGYVPIYAYQHKHNVEVMYSDDIPEGLEWGVHLNAEVSQVAQYVVYIRKYTGSEANLQIPDYIKGLPVTHINSYAFSENSSLQKVILPKHLYDIQNYAFYKCANLSEVVFNQPVEAPEQNSQRPSVATPQLKVGRYAFAETGLQNVLLPSVAKCGEGAFENCTYLTLAELGEGTKAYDAGMFTGCTNLTRIELPNSIEDIAGYATWNLKQLGLENAVHYVYENSVAHAFCASSNWEYRLRSSSGEGNSGAGLSAPVLHESFAAVKLGEHRSFGWTAVNGADFYLVRLLRDVVDEETGTVVSVSCGEYATNFLTTTDGKQNFDSAGIWYIDVQACKGSNNDGVYDITAASSSSRITVRVTEVSDEKTCDHKGYTYTDIYIDGSAPVYVDTGDGKNHLVRYKYNRTCSHCGNVISVVLSDGDPEAHRYVNGKCVCQYSQSDCDHNFVKKLSQNEYVPVKGSGVWEKYNDDYHIRISLRYWEVCTVCGLEREGTDEPDTGAQPEKHNFGETNWNLYQYDNSNHWRTGKKTCNSCKYVATVHSGYEAHTGIYRCMICSYQNQLNQGQDNGLWNGIQTDGNQGGSVSANVDRILKDSIGEDYVDQKYSGLLTKEEKERRENIDNTLGLFIGIYEYEQREWRADERLFAMGIVPSITDAFSALEDANTTGMIHGEEIVEEIAMSILDGELGQIKEDMENLTQFVKYFDTLKKGTDAIVEHTQSESMLKLIEIASGYDNYNDFAEYIAKEIHTNEEIVDAVVNVKLFSGENLDEVFKYAQTMRRLGLGIDAFSSLTTLAGNVSQTYLAQKYTKLYADELRRLRNATSSKALKNEIDEYLRRVENEFPDIINGYLDINSTAEGVKFTFDVVKATYDFANAGFFGNRARELIKGIGTKNEALNTLGKTVGKGASIASFIADTPSLSASLLGYNAADIIQGTDKMTSIQKIFIKEIDELYSYKKVDSSNIDDYRDQYILCLTLARAWGEQYVTVCYGGMNHLEKIGFWENSEMMSYAKSMQKRIDLITELLENVTEEDLRINNTHSTEPAVWDLR